MPVRESQVLRVEKAGMEAVLTLVPLSLETGGYHVASLGELEVWIREQGIQSDLDLSAIQYAIDKATEGLTADAVVSRAQPPQRGNDGYIEYLIDFGQALAPTVSDMGAIDLRASLIRYIQPGEPLAIIHPPDTGEPGQDVYGKPVAALPGKEFTPKLGANVQKSPNDANLVLSVSGGHARLVDGILDIQDFYQVTGDVDYGTGNVSFGKSVLIEGDVKAGFSVDSGGDLEVLGLVEDCQVKSQGKVLIKGGFTGQGKGLIQARGDVSIGYVRNQHVKSDRTILVLKEALNSRLQARFSVAINGLVAGGKVQARYAIECQIAGSDTGMSTELEAGFDFSTEEEMAGIRLEMEKMGTYARKLNESLRQIQDLEKLNRSLEPRSIELLFEMEGYRLKVEAKTKSLQERFSFLENLESDLDSACVTIHRMVFPGVAVKIGKEKYLVVEPMSGPTTFYAKDGEIKFR